MIDAGSCNEIGQELDQGDDLNDTYDRVDNSCNLFVIGSLDRQYIITRGRYSSKGTQLYNLTQHNKLGENEKKERKKERKPMKRTNQSPHPFRSR